MKSQKWQKILSMVLALTMVFSMLPMSVFAEDGEGGTETDANELPLLAGAQPETVVAKIDETGYETLEAAVSAAEAGQTIEIVEAGTYTVPGLPNNITVRGGEGVAVCFDCSVSGSISAIPNGATFEKVALDFGAQKNYRGFMHCPSLTFTNCTFKGEFWTYAEKLVLNYCTFSDANKYSLYVYGSDYVELNGCVFNGNDNGKAVKIAKDGDSSAVTVIANGCTFTGETVNKNAIMFDTRYSPITVIANGCTFAGAFGPGAAVESTTTGDNAFYYCWDEYAKTGGSIYKGNAAVGTNVVLDANHKIVSGNFVEFYGDTETLLADGSEVTQNNGTWTVAVKSDAPALPVAEVTTYDLTNEEDLAALAAVVGQDGFPICDFSNGLNLNSFYTLRIPDCAYKFAATEAAGDSEFGEWFADYTVSFDKPVAKDSMGLVGYYGTWGIGLGFLAPMEVPANVEVPLLNTMMNNSNWTYNQIIQQVGEFYCGAFNLSSANNDTTMTVKLRLFDPEVFDDPDNIQDPNLYKEGVNTYTIEEIQYKLTKNGAIPTDAVNYTVAGTADVGSPIPAGKFYLNGGEMVKAENDVTVTQKTAYFTDGKSVVVVDDDKNATVTTGQTSSVNEKDLPPVVQAKIDEIKTSTEVSGVELTTEGEGSGVQAIVNEALKDTEQAAAIKAAEEIEIKVDVAVTPKTYEADSTLKFDLTPVATLVAKKGDVETATVAGIEVSNDMIDQTQNITVKLYSDFEPKTVLHIANNGETTSYTKGQTPSGSTFTYDATNKQVSLIVHHFSTALLLNSEPVAMIGETPYVTLAEAASTAKSGDTIKLLQSCQLYNAGVDLSNKGQLTITAVNKDITLDFGPKQGQSESIAAIGGTNITFKDMTIKCVNADKDAWIYELQAASALYKDCNIIGTITTYHNTTFDGCVFNDCKAANGDAQYGVFAYGNNTVVKNCTFNTIGKAVKVFNNNNSGSFLFVAENNEFNATKANKAPIQVDSKGTGAFVVALVGTNKAEGVGFEGKALVNDSPSGSSAGSYFIENASFDENGKLNGGKCDKALPDSVIADLVTENYTSAQGEGGWNIEPKPELKPSEEDGFYHIASMADLNTFRSMVNGGNNFDRKTVVLDENITFEGDAWDSGIGINGAKFCGTFDGNGKTITDLKITGNQDFVALFGAVFNNAQIKNLTLSNPTISNTATDYTAGIVGHGYFTVENCKVSGGSITGVENVGGIVGHITSGTVKNCTVENVTINAKNRVGGIAGKAQTDSAFHIEGNTVKNSTITAQEQHGNCNAAALVGQVFANSGYTIIGNKSDTVTTTTNGDNTFVLIGGYRSGSWDGEAVSTGRVAKNNWKPVTDPDTQTVYSPDGNNSYVIENYYVASVTEGTTIVKYGDLREALLACDSANKTVTLLDDVDISGSEWTPVFAGTRSGKTYSGESFKGTFDGNNKTITGLTITTTSHKDYSLGLIGIVDGGTVKNLTLDAVSIAVPSSEMAGAAIGMIVNGGTAEKITVNGSIAVTRGVGGIVGRMTVSGTIKDCVNNATISGTGANVAGIVGAAYYTEADKTMTISGCTNNGAITGTAGGVGGIAGISAAEVSNCTNTAAITANGASVGGIISEQQNAGSIKGCTNSGTVTNNAGAGTYGTGGIVGWVRYSGAATDYAFKQIVEVSGNTNTANIKGANDAGGIVGTLYNAGIVNANNNSAEKIESTGFGGGIVGNCQFSETPVSPASYPIPSTSVEIKNNTSTTLPENMTATNKGAITYDNTLGIEGVVVGPNNYPVAKVDTTVYASVELDPVKGLAAAVAAANNGEKVVVLLTDFIHAKDATIPEGYKYVLGTEETLKVNKGRYTLNVEAPKGYTLKTVTAEGVTTYTAEMVPVAKIGTTPYASLAEAVAAVPANTETTIVMVADEVISGDAISIANNQKIVLDLNGKTISSSGWVLENYGDLTVCDSGEGGEIVARGAIDNYGTLTLRSGKLTATDLDGGASVWNNPAGTFNMEGGLLYVNEGHTESGNTPHALVNEGSALISGGEMNCLNDFGYALQNENASAVIEITPASGKTVTIHGTHGGMAVDAGTATVNGGSFGSTDWYGLYVSNDKDSANVTINGGTFDGASISVLVGSDIQDSVDSTVRINGGTFNKPIEAQSKCSDNALAVYGGTFSAPVPAEYCAPGFEPKDNGDGTYGVEPEPAAGLTWFSPDEEGQWQGEKPTAPAEKFDFDYAASNDGENLKLFVKYHGALTGSDKPYGNGSGTNFRIWLQLPETGYTSYNYLIDVSKKATTWDSQMKHNTAPAGNTGETVYAYGGTPAVAYTVTETADGAYLQMTIPLSAIGANILTEKQVNMVVTVSNKVEENYCLHSNNCGEGAHLATTWTKDGYAILKPDVDMYLASKYPQEPDPEPVATKNAAKIVRGGVDIQTYNTLNEAITAAQNGDTVVLLQAQNMGNVKITKNITLDLGGFTNRVNSMVLGQYDQGDYDITVQNGTITAGSTSTGASGGDGDGIFFANGAPGKENSNVRTFKDVTFTLNGISKGVAIFHNRSKLVFENCTINATNSKGNLLYNNGTAPQIVIKDSTVTASNLDGGLCQSWSDTTVTASAKGGFITAATCGITFDHSTVTATNLHAMPLNQQTIYVTNGSVVSINATGAYPTAKGINRSVVNVSGTGSKLTLSGLTNNEGGNLIGINCSSVNVSGGGELEIKDLPGSCAFQQCCLTADGGTVNVDNVNEAVYNAFEDEKIVLKNEAVMNITNIGDEAIDVLNGDTKYHDVVVELNTGASLTITDSAYSGLKNCDLTMDNAILNISGMGSTGINLGTTSIGAGSVVNISDCDKGNYGDWYDNTCIRATGNVTIAEGADVTCAGRVYADTGANAAIYAGKYYSAAAAEGGTMALYGGVYTVKPADALAADGYAVMNNSDTSTANNYPYMIAKAVAQIDDVKYASLQAALDAAQTNDTVTLLADVTESVLVRPGKVVTLDMAGHTLTESNDNTLSSYNIDNQGTLTITGNGYIVDANDGDNSSLIRNLGTMTIENGTFTSKYGCNVVKNDGDEKNADGENVHTSYLTVNGGTFKQETSNAQYSVINSWTNTTINGGEFIGNGVEGSTAISSGGDSGDETLGKLTITGGTFTNFDYAVKLSKSYGNCGVATISGGKFTGKIAMADETGTYSISGGYFSSEVDAAYVADGYKVVANTDPDTKEAYPYTVILPPVTTDVAENFTAEKPEGVTVEQVNTEVQKLMNNTEVAKAETNLEAAVDLVKIAQKVAADSAEASDTQIQIKLESVKVETQPAATSITLRTAVYDVTPWATITTTTTTAGGETTKTTVTRKLTNDEIKSGVTVRLAVPETTAKLAKVTHKSSDYPTEAFYSEVLGMKPNQYVELLLTHFSEIGLELEENAVAVAKNKETEKVYTTLEAALEEATSGQTVELLKNIGGEGNAPAEKFVVVETGVKLDLKGYSITGATFMYVTGTIMDTGATKGIIDAYGYVFGSNENYVPIYDSVKGGYSFCYNEFTTSTTKMDGNTLEFNLKLSDTERSAAYGLLKQDSDYNLRYKVIVTVKWSVTGMSVEKNFSYDKSFIDNVLPGGYGFTAGISGVTGEATIQPKIVIFDSNGNEMFSLNGPVFGTADGTVWTKR